MNEFNSEHSSFSEILKFYRFLCKSALNVCQGFLDRILNLCFNFLVYLG